MLFFHVVLSSVVRICYCLWDKGQYTICGNVSFIAVRVNLSLYTFHTFLGRSFKKGIIIICYPFKISLLFVMKIFLQTTLLQYIFFLKHYWNKDLRGTFQDHFHNFDKNLPLQIFECIHVKKNFDLYEAFIQIPKFKIHFIKEGKDIGAPLEIQGFFTYKTYCKL